MAVYTHARTIEYVAYLSNSSKYDTRATGIHRFYIVLHGEELWQRFTQHFNIPNEKYRTRFICGILIVITIVLGICASVLNHVGDCLHMEHVFSTEAKAMCIKSIFP